MYNCIRVEDIRDVLPKSEIDMGDYVDDRWVCITDERWEIRLFNAKGMQGFSMLPVVSTRRRKNEKI